MPFIPGNEEQYALETLTSLAANNIQPRHLVTDGDSAAHRAGDTLYSTGVLASRPIRAHDPTHNVRRMGKHVQAASFSARAFPTADLRSTKQGLQCALARDLPYRCSWEHRRAYDHFSGDKRRIQRRMTFVIDCLVRCYQNDHSHCRRTSFVCRPGRPWYQHSPYIKKNFIMQLEGEDEETFRKLCQFRIGGKNLDYMNTLRSTQKCEAVNRGLSASCPKTVTFSRNFPGRIHSAAAQINRGPGGAIFDQLAAVGCRVAPGTRVARALLKMNIQSDRRRAYSRSLKYKLQRCRRRHYWYRKHNEKKEKDTYRPGMVYETQDTPAALADHSYVTRRKHRPMVL